MRRASTNLLYAILLLVVISGCSQEAAYYNVQRHNYLQCLHSPPPEDVDCLKTGQGRFKDYQQALEDLKDH